MFEFLICLNTSYVLSKTFWFTPAIISEEFKSAKEFQNIHKDNGQQGNFEIEMK